VADQISAYLYEIHMGSKKGGKELKKDSDVFSHCKSTFFQDKTREFSAKSSAYQIAQVLLCRRMREV
jgi:hypothetical protein